MGHVNIVSHLMHHGASPNTTNVVSSRVDLSLLGRLVASSSPISLGWAVCLGRDNDLVRNHNLKLPLLVLLPTNTTGQHSHYLWSCPSWISEEGNTKCSLLGYQGMGPAAFLSLGFSQISFYPDLCHGERRFVHDHKRLQSVGKPLFLERHFEATLSMKLIPIKAEHFSAPTGGREALKTRVVWGEFVLPKLARQYLFLFLFCYGLPQAILC